MKKRVRVPPSRKTHLVYSKKSTLVCPVTTTCGVKMVNPIVTFTWHESQFRDAYTDIFTAVEGLLGVCNKCKNGGPRASATKDFYIHGVRL